VLVGDVGPELVHVEGLLLAGTLNGLGSPALLLLGHVVLQGNTYKKDMKESKEGKKK